jgi:hypothetical protein
LRKQLEAIEKLKNDIEQNKTTAEQKIASLEEHKKEAEANNSNKRKELLDRQALELEKKRNEYTSLMLEDASKFQSLQAQKDQYKKNFHEEMDMQRRKHEQKVQAMEREHATKMDLKRYEVNQCNAEIDKIQMDNEERIRQIKLDAVYEIEDIN